MMLAVEIDLNATPIAGFTHGRERFNEARAHALAGHLHEPKARDFRDLMLGAVTREALDHAAQHKIAIGFEDHIDEVHHDNAADVAKAKLANDLLGRLEVVTGHGFFERTASSRELARVDVNDGHGLGAIDDE